MRAFKGKRYWIVGASEGLGRAVAEQLSRKGANVIVSARNADRLRALAETLPGEARAVPVDVGDRLSVEAAAAEIGRIDGVVFLAGVYWPMKATEWDAARVEMMCDVNFTGAARVLGAVMPRMLERNAGHVVLTGSLSGFRGLPGTIGYGASKAGVMYLAESMKADLRGSGIDVQVVNPGFIRTRLTDKNSFRMPFIMEPDEAARELVAHMRTGRFKHSFPRLFSWMFRLSQFLPDWAYYRLFGQTA
ncbi:MAG: SDR family NAD(P)-dependent oxidoreductase [Pseudomonadota bacterium]